MSIQQDKTPDYNDYNYIYNLCYKNSIYLPNDFHTKYTPERVLKMLMIGHNLDSYEPYRFLPYSRKLYLIESIENSCYSAVENEVSENDNFKIRYDFVCGNVISNLDITGSVNSDFLIKNLLNETISPHDVGSMLSEELCPEITKQLREYIQKRSNVVQNIKYSTMYKCGKCKTKQCALERMHIRGLDEGTNYRVTCLYCRHTWMT
jgi:DNA-directed RNA polymerase subunit M/transcription elongation factor TFIIS